MKSIYLTKKNEKESLKTLVVGGVKVRRPHLRLLQTLYITNSKLFWAKTKLLVWSLVSWKGQQAVQ